MAYPVKLFDFETIEGCKEGTKFLQKFDKNLTALFGIIQPTDKQRKFHSWETGKVPKYLTTLATNIIQKILTQLPGGELKWKGTVGVYGRKSGSVIKREENILYRMIINLGPTEIYYLNGDTYNSEPAALLNGYSLICSPVIIDNIDIKVRREPFRKNLDKRLIGFVPKIRGRKYLRSTIVLDLLLDGLDVPDLQEAGKLKDQGCGEGCNHNHNHNTDVPDIKLPDIKLNN